MKKSVNDVLIKKLKHKKRIKQKEKHEKDNYLFDDVNDMPRIADVYNLWKNRKKKESD